MTKKHDVPALRPWQRLVGILHYERSTINYIFFYAVLIGLLGHTYETRKCDLFQDVFCFFKEKPITQTTCATSGFAAGFYQVIADQAYLVWTFQLFTAGIRVKRSGRPDF